MYLTIRLPILLAYKLFQVEKDEFISFARKTELEGLVFAGFEL